MIRLVSFIALAVSCLLVFAAPAARADSELETLQFVTRTGKHGFAVEVMRTPEQQGRGLMYRRYMPDDRGMLFAFGRNQVVTMWMKNTYIPLDMVFISRNGKVVTIAYSTEPLSEKTISSGAPAWAVVELNAGAAANIGLAIGDTVRHPIFGD
jgi:uncharacterized protein